MTADEAAKTADLMCQMWPAPELTDDGFRMLVIAIADTGLTTQEAQVGIRTLMQGNHRFRPNPYDLVRAARPPKPLADYHRPFAEVAGELPAAPVDQAVGREAIAAMRAAMAAANQRAEGDA